MLTTKGANVKFKDKTKLKKELSPEGRQAISVLHSAGKPISEFVEWTALDTFRMSKAEDIPGEGLKITVVEFQIKEIK